MTSASCYHNATNLFMCGVGCSPSQASVEGSKSLNCFPSVVAVAARLRDPAGAGAIIVESEPIRQ